MINLSKDQENAQKIEENIEKDFHISKYIIVYKFVLGIIELFLGLGIIFLEKQTLELYQKFKSQELLEDPHDTLIFILEKIIPYIFEHQGYIVLVLIALGLVKIIGSIGLLYHKHWGLDLLVALTVLLLPIDGYLLLTNPSLSKAIFFTINLLIALYLVNFNPKGYFSDLKKRAKS